VPLLDHFRPPVSQRQPWEAFHAAWANSLMAQLNARLPERFLASSEVRRGPHIEADVAEFDQGDAAAANGSAGGVAVAAYAPPVVAATVELTFPDEIEVEVFDTRDGRRLVAVVELVSPSNKDCPASRQAFADKCSAYLHRGIGLAVIDVVTDRAANLHAALMQHLGTAASRITIALYATAYRPLQRDGRSATAVWEFPLAVGEGLPTLPLALLGWGFVPLDLEAAHADARQRTRL
jgi:hypothetical protein